jgi:speckle-type POZ protein
MSRPQSPSVRGDTSDAASTPAPRSTGGDTGDAADTPTPQRTASQLSAWSNTPSIFCFVVEVREYTRRTQGPGSGMHITEFDESGRIWHVKIYPSAARLTTEAGSPSSCSSTVAAASGIDGETAMAQFSVSFLDQDGEPVPSYSRDSSAIRRFGLRDQYGHRRFIAGHDLKRYLRDDCFSLRCEVVVHGMYGTPLAPRRPVVVPPSDLKRQLLALLRSERGGE